MRPLSLALGALLFSAPLVAQGNCSPGSNSREADLFGHFSVPLAFSASQAPWIYIPGSIQIGLEGTYLPDANDHIATPTKCRPGKGPENVNLLSAFPRPRIAFALPDGVMLEASWVPPVRLNGVKPNLWGLSLSRTVPINAKGAMFSGRAHATFGSIKAPFVCSEDDVKDAGNVDCFGGEKSDDKYSPNIFGVELAFGWAWAQGRLRPYLGSGYNIIHPRFQVNYTRADSSLDDTKIRVNFSRWVLFGGFSFQPSQNFMFSTEAYTAPSDLITGRVKASFIFGGRKLR